MAQPGTAPPVDAERDRVGGNGVLVAMCLGLGLATLAATAVNVTLPDVGESLHAKLSGLQWVANAYTLVYAAVLLPAGSLGDRIGRRRLFLAGSVIFAVGAAGCATAPNLAVLIGARAFAGAGSAAMVPTTLAIVTAEYDSAAQRARALGVWAGTASLGLAAGPLVGGVLVQQGGWRAVFGLVAVLAAVSGALGAVLVSADKHDRPAGDGVADVPGSLLGVVWLGSLSFALIEARAYGWTSPVILGSFACTVVGLAAFLLVERGRDRAQRSPLMPLRIWRSPSFVVANLGGAGYFLSLFGILFFFSLYLQEAESRSALSTGVMFLPLTLAMAVLAPYAGRIVAGFGVRPVVTVGLTVAAVGCLTLATLPTHAGEWAIGWRFLLTGVGFGLSSAPLTTAAVAAAPADTRGLASAVFNASRQVGAVLGVTALGAVVTVQPAGANAAAASAFLDGVHTAMVLAAGCLLVCAIAGVALLRSE